MASRKVQLALALFVVNFIFGILVGPVSAVYGTLFFSESDEGFRGPLLAPQPLVHHDLHGLVQLCQTSGMPAPVICNLIDKDDQEDRVELGPHRKYPGDMNLRKKKRIDASNKMRDFGRELSSGARLG